MKTAEEILDKLEAIPSDGWRRKDILQAMEEYASQSPSRNEVGEDWDEVVEDFMKQDLKYNLWDTNVKTFIDFLKSNYPAPKSENNISRIEVIDSTGRIFSRWNKGEKVEFSYQDEGRTLKLFIKSLG